MSTAESLADSIKIDQKGIHLLLWDDKGELTRTLIVLLAALEETPKMPLLFSSAEEVEQRLGSLFAIKPRDDTDTDEFQIEAPKNRNEFLILFLQQAASSTICPLLNGWRTALAESPGSLIVVRSADFGDFQRFAPDLASFVGPKIHDCSVTLSIWGEGIAKRIKTELPESLNRILKKLPGEKPSKKEIQHWLSEHPPLN